MKKQTNRGKSPIISGKLAITGGLAVFLAVGFAGCDSNNSDCKDPYAPQWKVDECKKSGYVRTGGSSNATQSHTGFIPMFFNNSLSGGSYGSGSTSSNNSSSTSSSKSSGFFGSSGSSSHSSSSGSSSGG